jgi:hypothetical protein
MTPLASSSDVLDSASSAVHSSRVLLNRVRRGSTTTFRMCEKSRQALQESLLLNSWADHVFQRSAGIAARPKL